MNNMGTIWILVAASAWLLVVAGEMPTLRKSLPCDRLPANVMPTKYELFLDFSSFSSDTYSGRVDISLKIPHKTDPEYSELRKGLEGETCNLQDFGSKAIVLHADKNIVLEDVTMVTDSCGLLDCYKVGNKNRLLRSVKRDMDKQLLSIKLVNGMSAGDTGVLSIKFAGRLRDDKRGVYKSRYDDGLSDYVHIVSQFQPTDARKVFPVFDEPRFKAPFKVSIRHPHQSTVLSNMEAEKIEGQVIQVGRHQRGIPYAVTTFKQTPPMSPHMLAFVVGNFDKPLVVEAKSAISGHTYKVRVFTEPGKRESGRFALEVAQRSLQHFEKYIDYQYPLDKFDIVAIADHDKDNTESWGLSFIRDNLVWIDDETKPDTKITTAVNVAHVCVHQWFANLVTAAWWNDLWITEGVAAQFAFKLVRELYPEFESEYFVRIATLSGVMQLDAPGKLHPLSPPLDELHTSEQIYAIFDNVEFMKSGALAQTMNKWLDATKPNWYQAVLRSLVRKFAHKNFNYGDYLDAIKTTVESEIWGSKIDLERVEALLDSQKSIRGVPLVNAVLELSEFHVDAELLANARKSVLVKQIPPNSVLVYDDALVERVNAADNTKLSETFVPTKPFSNMWWNVQENPQYVKLGAKPDINTYYRTRYDSVDYKSFCEPIRRREMSPMDRLQILDDANVLAQANLIYRLTFEQLLECYADEDNGAVLIELVLALKTQPSSPSSKAVLRIFEKDGFAATGSETFLEQRSRSVGLKALIMQGNQQVIEAALKKFDEGDVALFLREPVYTAVAMHGTETQIKKLLGQLARSPSFEEKLRAANALALSSDHDVLDSLEVGLKHKSHLNKDVIKPILDLIEPKLYPQRVAPKN